MLPPGTLPFAGWLSGGWSPAGVAFAQEAKQAMEKSPSEEEEEADEDEDSPTTGMIDLQKAGLFKRSKDAIQGRTRGGLTILDAPPFKVWRRKTQLEYFPCSDCHEEEVTNPKERKLTEEHEDIVLQHGQGRFWCLTCHGTPNKDALSSLKGKPIDFDHAFALCGQCHFQRQKDWYFGGHGKRAGAWPDPRKIPLLRTELKVEDRERIGTWRGTRVLLSCPACHNPHSPSIKPYRPSPPPTVRKGLKHREKYEIGHPPIWVRLKGEHKSEQH